MMSISQDNSYGEAQLYRQKRSIMRTLYVVIHIAPEGAIAQVKVGRSHIALGWVDNTKPSITFLSLVQTRSQIALEAATVDAIARLK